MTSSQHRNNFDAHLIRTNSICPTPNELLLDYVESNDIDKITILLASTTNSSQLLAHIYGHPHDKPILQIACGNRNVAPETVQLLIDAGADLTRALHLAADATNTQLLPVIIKNLSSQNGGRTSINTTIDGNNALHYLIKCADTDTMSTDDFIETARILIRNGIDVNQADLNGCSVTLLAARKGNARLIKVILEETDSQVDLDSHKLRNKSARDFIIAGNLYDIDGLPEPVTVQDHDGRSPVQILFDFIKQSKQNEFIDFYGGNNNELASLDVDDGETTLLQLSCMKHLTRIVQYLLDKGCDCNLTTIRVNKTPIRIAAEIGHYEIFELLLNSPKILISNQIVCDLIKNIDNDKIPGAGIDYEQCYNLLMQKLRSNPQLIASDINDEDELRNTPLHYAVRYAGREKTLELLDLGASLACKNDYGTMPIEDIEPDTLHRHLDNCIKFDVKSKNFDKQDFEITFDYHSLMPPPKSSQQIRMLNNHHNQLFQDRSKVEQLVEETAVIAYMSRAPEFKHLLKHPIIVTFLFMKWYRICWLFYTNLTFYITFVLSLIVYIFSYYQDDDNNNDINALASISWTILILTFIVLLIREFFQIAVSSTKYFKNFENYIEIILIIITAMILFINSPSKDTRKQLSAIAILLAAFELVLMVGQHPKLSTNVVMLRTVSYNFFKFLLWYSLLILAFAFSFYILFTPQHNNLTTTSSNDDDNNDDSFQNPARSIFKTVVMLTGEFDASSINFNTYPIISKLIFSLFIFMIVIILLNLLNGLAVSDTQMIKDDAELVGHIVRAQHIHYVEVMLLGNIMPTKLMNLFNHLCCCLPTIMMIDINTYGGGLIKPLSRQVCLFTQLNHSQVTILPNNHGQILVENYGGRTINSNNNKGTKLSCWSCSSLYLDKETNLRIRSVIQGKKDESNRILRRDETEHTVITRNLQEALDDVRNEQIAIRKKLDNILNLLGQNNN